MKLNFKKTPLRTTFILVMISLTGITTQAQNKKEQRLLDLYKNGQILKAEKKAKKLLGKQRTNKYANWVMCSTYFSRFQHTSKSSGLTGCLRYLKYVDTTQPNGQQLRAQIKLALLELANDSTINQRYQQKYQRALAQHFNIQLPKKTSPQFITFETPVNSKTDSMRAAMMTYAKSLVGTPYKYGGTSKKGFDCSGFTQNVYDFVDVKLPHNAHMQKQLLAQRIPLNQLKPGDLIFFGNPNSPNPRANHAGIIYENKNGEISVIHCVTGGVKIEGKDSSWDRYWINYVIHAISLDHLLSSDLAKHN